MKLFGCFKKCKKGSLSDDEDTSSIDFSQEFIDNVKDINHNYENLAFEGGGVKGISLAAAVVELWKLGILDDIKRFAGSSAGSIIAAGLAIGYMPQEIVKIMLDTDFEDFLDDSIGVALDANRLVNKYGYCKGKYFLKWAKDLIKDKTGDSKYTFGDLWNDRKIELIITGTNLTKQRLDLFSHKTHPNMPIATAVRISMSIPFLFVPFEYEDCLYVDGGVLNNYPIDVFGKGNAKTLGIKLITDDEERRKTENEDMEFEIDNVGDFTTSLINIMLLEIEKKYVEKSYWDRTIAINTGTVSSMEFDLDEDKANFLYKRGKKAVRKFFNIVEK